MKRQAKMWVMACMGLAVLAPRLAAQEVHPDTLVSREHQIDRITVTAPRTFHKVASAAPVQTFSQQDITRLGIQNMADAVRRFAGANVKDYGGIGGLKTVSIRNMGAAHTAVSYDGVPVSNCQAGQIDIGRFPLENVSMLSLAIGQHDDLLQSARLYASAGVLSIATETPHFEAGKKMATKLMVRGGSFGYFSPALRWWQQVGNRTKVAVDANLMRADGNYPFTLTNAELHTKEKRNNSHIFSWQGELALYHTFADDSELDVKGQYYYSRRGLPGAVTYYNPKSDERLWDKNGFVQARYRKQFSSQWCMQALAKYNYGWNKYTDQGKQYHNNYYEERNRQNEYFLSATVLYNPAEAWSLSLAQDGQLNKLHSTLPDCPYPTRYTSTSALNARYQKGWLSATATVVYAATSEHVKTGDTPDNFSRLAPSLSLRFQPWQQQSLYFRLMYKNAFRLPTFNDLYYYQLGNRELRPEKANEFNIGITWSDSHQTWCDYVSLTVDAYYNNVKDKIVAFPTTYAWKMANFGKVHAGGVDVSLTTAFRLSKDLLLSLSGNYMWQKAIDVTDPDAKNYKDQLPYTPKHSGQAALILESPWVNVGYSVVGMGKRYFLAQNLPANEIDGYLEHTLTLSHEFKLRGVSLLVQSELINFTNEQYDVIKYYPMPGRSWRLAGTLKF